MKVKMFLLVRELMLCVIVACCSVKPALIGSQPDSLTDLAGGGGGKKNEGAVFSRPAADNSAAVFIEFLKEQGAR